jgi:PDZ domain
LYEIYSNSSDPIRLEVKRGMETKEVDVGRVRESTLAYLSNEKYALVGGLIGFFGPLIDVPFDEPPTEIREFRSFQDRIFANYAFKAVDGVYVPIGTTEGQVEQVLAARQSTRIVGRIGLGANADSYSPGFRAMVLTHPDEVLVETVIPGSPAHRAGLFPGDQIEEINGRNTFGLTLQEMRDLLLKPEGQRETRVKLDRNGSVMTLDMGTSMMKDLDRSDPDHLTPPEPVQSGDQYILGIHVLQAESTRETMIAYVQNPSSAFAAGLHVGDRLLTINGMPVGQIDREGLNKLLLPTAGTEIILEIERLQKMMNFTLRPETYRAALASIGRKPTKLGPAPQ